MRDVNVRALLKTEAPQLSLSQETWKLVPECQTDKVNVQVLFSFFERRFSYFGTHVN